MINTLAKFNSITGLLDLITDTRINQVVTVGASGCQYTTIQAAINSILDATMVKQYIVQCSPGIYAENITMKPFVNLIGLGNAFAAPIITGTLTASFTNPGETAALNRINIARTIASDGEIVVSSTGSLLLNDFFLTITNTLNYGFTGIKLNNTTFIGIILSANISITSTFDGSTKDMIGVDVLGAAPYSSTQTSTNISVAASSGSIVGRRINSTGYLDVVGNTISITNTKAGFSGEACCSRVTSASTDFRISQGERFKNLGVSEIGRAHV